jgi:hypothetical protein
MPQIVAKIFKGIDLIGVRPPACNERISQTTIATGNFSQRRGVFDADLRAQILGDTLHARAIILESLTSLTTRRSRQQA